MVGWIKKIDEKNRWMVEWIENMFEKDGWMVGWTGKKQKDGWRDREMDGQEKIVKWLDGYKNGWLDG